MNNSVSRLHDVFFYGLYMDPEILRAKSVEPRNPRLGYAAGYTLRIGNMATLLRDTDPSARAFGLVYALTHAELSMLYDQAGLDMYIAEALLVTLCTADGLDSGTSLPSLCCNLLEPPADHESNPAYQARLLQCMLRLGVPSVGISEGPQ